MNEESWYASLIDEWDNEKNNGSIAGYSHGSSKKVWWKCLEYGHSYEMPIKLRFIRGYGCPYCSGRRFLQGFNDLETLYPELAKEFDEKNNILPSKIYPSKSKKVWWKCKKDHSYSATFGNRINGTKCPYCANRKILVGFNDLTTTHPELAKEWNFEKNIGINIQDSTYGSSKKVWWKCQEGHEWKTAVSKRQTRNCPYCVNQKIMPGYNDLATINPELAKEWNYSKNIDTTPTMISPTTPKKYWWLCSIGHEWEATVGSRANYKTGCPFCSNYQALSGYNDLLTKNSELVLQNWDYEKNHQIKIAPNKVSSGSNVEVWWKCAQKHSWKMSIKDRTALKSECPYCFNRRLLQGFNDLATMNPELLEEWDYEKNKQNPEHYNYKSLEKVWWICKKQHQWKSQIYTRTILKSQCLRCHNRKHRSNPENELMEYIEKIYGEITIHSREVIPPYELDIYIPELRIAIEFNGLYWHSERNGKTKEYHYNKWLMCKNNGIQLITIWEDDWKSKKNYIKKHLKLYIKTKEMGKKSNYNNSYIITKNKNIAVPLVFEEYLPNAYTSYAINYSFYDKDFCQLGFLLGDCKDGIFKIAEYFSLSNHNILKLIIQNIAELEKVQRFEYEVKNEFSMFQMEIEEIFQKCKINDPNYKILINSKRYDKTDIAVCKYIDAKPNVKLNKIWDSGSQVYTFVVP